ncbi:MAG: putative manganese-dependent inorganic diphosphatase [Opitutales bacterium]|nr:putative manganese-dependent inorganic diphosphatase [Opitutales bacterium]
MKTDSIYIIGHKNPDVDSICSALAYADLKQMQGFENYKAARAGNSNARIDRVLKKFGAQLPEFVGDVRLRAGSVMKRKFISLPTDASCFSVMENIDKHDLRTIPLVDENMVLQGEVSVFDLGEFFIPRPDETRQVRRLRASLNDVIKTLNADVKCVFCAEKTEDMFVRVGAMEAPTFSAFMERADSLASQNLIVVGDRFDIQIKAIQLGVRALIITGGYAVDESVVEMARAKNVSVLSCKYDSATTALLVRMATRAQPLMRKNFATVGADYLLSKISGRINDFFGKTIFVCGAGGRLEGVFTNTDLLNVPKPRLVLVDHNEISQAVAGADEAEILEIIDHHRIGINPTSSPILFINKPVGSTCTIISQLFRRAGLRPNRRTAGLLFSGIVCDTLNLKSPTATSEDAEEIRLLSKIAGMESGELSEYIFSADSVVLSSDAAGVIASDCKRYRENGFEFSVSQIEELDFAAFYSKIGELRAALEEYRSKNSLFFSALFVTNVMTQDSVLMICGLPEFAAKISYAKDAERGVFELPKIVSRKKQLVPYLAAILNDFEK